MQLRQVLRLQPNSLSSSVRSFATVITPQPAATTGQELRAQNGTKYGPYAGRFRDVEKHGLNPLTVSQLAMRPSGSMLFRCEMIDGADEAKNYIVENVLNDLAELVHTESGSWLVSTIMDYGCDEHKEAIAQAVLQNLHAFAKDQCATVAVSKIVQNGYAAEVSETMTASPEHVDMYFKDPYASYVLASLVEFGTAADRDVIARAAKGYVLELSKTESTNHIVQKIFQSLEPGTLRDELIAELCVSPQAVLEVCESEFGNYVIQSLMEFGSDAEKQFAVDAIKGNVMSLSISEFGSHVVQRCGSLSEAQRSEVVGELASNPENMLLCCLNPFGGYVMQWILTDGIEAHKAALLEVLKANAVAVAMSPYGRFVVERARSTLSDGDRTVLLDALLHDPADVKRCSHDENSAMLMQHIVHEEALSHRNAVIDAIVNNDDIVACCTDPNCHYVVQAILKRDDVTPEQRSALISALLSSPETTSEIALNKYGSFTIQRVLQSGSSEERSRMFGALKDILLEMFEYNHATFCVSNMVTVLEGEDRAQLSEKLISTHEAVVRLACDKHANYVLKEFLMADAPEDEKMILAGLKSDAATIVADRIGVYSILNALSLMTLENRNELIDELLKDTESIISIAQNTKAKVVLKHILEKGTIEQAKLVNDALQTI